MPKPLPTLRGMAVHIDRVLRQLSSKSVEVCGCRGPIERTWIGGLRKTISTVRFYLRGDDNRNHVLFFSHLDRLTHIWVDDQLYKMCVAGGRYVPRSILDSLLERWSYHFPRGPRKVHDWVSATACMAEGELADFADQEGEYEPGFLHETVHEDVYA